MCDACCHGLAKECYLLPLPHPGKPNSGAKTGGQQSPPTTGQWAYSHINSSFQSTNQTKISGSEFRSHPPWLLLHSMCTSSKSAQNFNSWGYLQMVPSPTSNHHNSRQCAQSFGTLTLGLLHQSILEHAWRMCFFWLNLAYLPKSTC